MKKHEILSPQSNAALFDPPTDTAAIVCKKTTQCECRARRKPSHRIGAARHIPLSSWRLPIYQIAAIKTAFAKRYAPRPAGNRRSGRSGYSRNARKTRLRHVKNCRDRRRRSRARAPHPRLGPAMRAQALARARRGRRRDAGHRASANG